MFKIFKLNDDKYLILNGKREFEGTQTSVIKELILMGVQNEDIVIGLEALMDYDHDVAHYGYKRTFIFSETLVKRSA